jgi:hypothetical protein
MSAPTISHTNPIFPAVENNIPNDPTPTDEAVWVPSVSPGYAVDVYNNNFKRNLPTGVTADMLNFLSPTNRGFFHISHVMSSAGQALNQTKPCIITQRDRLSTLAILDSGGYQVSSGRLNIRDNNDRLKILRWQEKHADVAMTLDVPTGRIGHPDYRYKTFKECLDDTMVNLKHFATWRNNRDVIFLNVLQGNNRAQCDEWYNTVKWAPCEGWAFAGPRRLNMYEFLRRILIMEREGEIQDKKWIHVLGTAELETAVLLTAIQRSIKRNRIAENLRISLDTSTPWRILARKSILTLPKFENKQMTMPLLGIPDGEQFVNSTVRWPWPSPLGDRMVMGDISITLNKNASSYLDVASYHLLAHHNLSVMCNAISLANRVFNADRISPIDKVGYEVSQAIEKVEEVLSSRDEFMLQKHKAYFESLRHGKSDDSGDEHREFE